MLFSLCLQSCRLVFFEPFFLHLHLLLIFRPVLSCPLSISCKFLFKVLSSLVCTFNLSANIRHSSIAYRAVYKPLYSVLLHYFFLFSNFKQLSSDSSFFLRLPKNLFHYDFFSS